MLIFAKLNTSEKAIIDGSKNNVLEIQKAMREKHGGSWLLVDEIVVSTQAILVDDGEVYKGFDGRDGYYIQGVDYYHRTSE